MLGILVGILAPQLVIDGLSANQLSVVLEQQDEQLHGYSLELYRLAGPAQFVALEV
jgi:hypothetical protein